MKQALKITAAIIGTIAAAVLLMEFVKLIGAALILIHEVTGILL